MGFGRIGRNFFRQVYEHEDIDIVAISELGSPEAMAYLLEFDTIYGRFPHEVKLEGKYLSTGRQHARLVKGLRPEDMPWDVFDVDVVIDTTMKYRRKSELQGHLDSGAPRVILSRPALDPIDRTIIHGVNHESLGPQDRIISVASATCHALALALKVLDDAAVVDHAMMTSVHAYTSDQKLSDAMASELRRSRSAAENLIPNLSWAPDVVTKIMPQLAGRVEGMAVNVPVPNGSCLDLAVQVRKPMSIEEINEAFRVAAEGPMSEWLGYATEPVVSSDVIGMSESAVFDSLASISMEGGLAKIIAWYDNGWGITARIVDTLLTIREFIRKGVA
jgi:glyceraldehyde 3-phosphate dehydrogenase